MDWFRDAAYLLDTAPSDGLAVACVVEVAGSVPRHVGAKMWVATDGRQWGTIGGGRIEQVVTAAAQRVAATGQAEVVTQHLVRDLAMCCGGRMTIAIVPWAHAAPAFAAAIAHGPQSVAWLCIARDGARAWLETAPDTATPSWREALQPRVRVVVFGAGHVGRHIARLAAMVEFDVVLCDDGDTGALVAPLEGPAQVIESFTPAEVSVALGGWRPHDCLLIVTRDHALDQQLLEALLVAEVGYLGMIGSRGKVARFRKRLEAKLGVTEAQWARLHAPIGLAIGAETPAEIAVAVIAQLIATRRGWRDLGRAT